LSEEIAFASRSKRWRRSSSSAKAGQDIAGDAPVEARVLAAPDLAHSAGADRRQKLVGPEP
jgi:hypothetical protein